MRCYIGGGYGQRLIVYRTASRNVSISSAVHRSLHSRSIPSIRWTTRNIYFAWCPPIYEETICSVHWEITTWKLNMNRLLWMEKQTNKQKAHHFSYDWVKWITSLSCQLSIIFRFSHNCFRLHYFFLVSPSGKSSITMAGAIGFEFLKCQICEEEYNSRDRLPLIIACGHTVCQMWSQTSKIFTYSHPTR